MGLHDFIDHAISDEIKLSKSNENAADAMFFETRKIAGISVK